MGFRRTLCRWAAVLILPLLLLLAAPVQAIDNPELLPDHPTPVIDLARVFSTKELQSLEVSLDAFEQRSGWKIRC